MANKVKIMELKNKQLILTFPKAIAQAMNIKKGDNIEFKLHMGEIVLRKVEE